MKPIHSEPKKHGVSLLKIQFLSPKEGIGSRIAGINQRKPLPCHRPVCSPPLATNVPMPALSTSRFEPERCRFPFDTQGSQSKESKDPLIFTKPTFAPMKLSQPAQPYTMERVGSQAKYPFSPKPCYRLTEPTFSQPFLKKSSANQRFHAFNHSSDLYAPILISGEVAIK